MPELPEVETVRRGLAELLAGKTARAVTVFDSPKSFPNSPEQVNEFFIGATVVDVRRRGKALIIDLDTDYALVIHLKMTGQLVFRASSALIGQFAEPTSPSSLTEGSVFPTERTQDDGSLRVRVPEGGDDGEAVREFTPSAENFAGGHPTDSLIGELPDRSTRVEIGFSDGSHLYFNDQRKFGWIKLMPTLAVDELPFMQKLGPEPLDPATTPTDFIQRIRRRNNSMIKPVILDQSVIAGVGNIYADESLWSTKIHPETRVQLVSDKQLESLFAEIVAVLQLSIDKGGSTDKNYVDAEGRKGSYLTFANVFRREGQGCRIHPDQPIVKIRVAGRGTHICPVCQKKDEEV